MKIYANEKKEAPFIWILCIIQQLGYILDNMNNSVESEWNIRTIMDGEKESTDDLN